MKLPTQNLLSDLIARTGQNLNLAKHLDSLAPGVLNYKSSPDSWSALECLAHLNFYGDFYLPEIERRIKDSRYPAEAIFKPGLLGNYFAKMMLPGDKMKPMRTLRSTNPNGSNLEKGTIEKFIQQQKIMLDLLDRARKVSLNKTRASISIAPLLKLRLGDTFRVVIYHNDRHIAQALRAVKEAEEA